MSAFGVAGELVGVVGRARQEDRRAFRALRNQDDGVQLDAVAHGDHHLAPDVVEAVVGRLELGRDLARQCRVGGGRLGICLRHRRAVERSESANRNEAQEQTSPAAILKHHERHLSNAARRDFRETNRQRSRATAGFPARIAFRMAHAPWSERTSLTCLASPVSLSSRRTTGSRRRTPASGRCRTASRRACR